MQTRFVAERKAFTVKFSWSERELAARLAHFFRKPVSDLLRDLMLEKARELGPEKIRIPEDSEDPSLAPAKKTDGKKPARRGSRA